MSSWEQCWQGFASAPHTPHAQICYGATKFPSGKLLDDTFAGPRQYSTLTYLSHTAIWRFCSQERCLFCWSQKILQVFRPLGPRQKWRRANDKKEPKRFCRQFFAIWSAAVDFFWSLPFLYRYWGHFKEPPDDFSFSFIYWCLKEKSQPQIHAKKEIKVICMKFWAQWGM